MPNRSLDTQVAIHSEQIQEAARQVAELACAAKPIAELVIRDNERLRSQWWHIVALWGVVGSLIGGLFYYLAKGP